MKTATCRYCAVTFEISRSWQQYCSERCRVKYWEESNPRQKVEGDSSICYYCGSPANTIDHVPPQVARKSLIHLGLQDKYPFKEVQCCHECNSALGARGLWTLPKRKRYIKAYLERKYKKYLRIPNWSEEELRNMGPTLRSDILNGIIIRDIIRNRLRW